MAAPDWDAGIAPRRYDQGRVLVRAWHMFRQSWSSMLLAGLLYAIVNTFVLIISPLIQFQVMPSGTGNTAFLLELIKFLLPSFLLVILASIPSAWIIRRCMAAEMGNAWTSLVFVLRHAVPLILISLVYEIALYAGIMVLIVPGIMIVVIWFVSFPVFLHQPKLGIWGSLKESAILSRGYRWQILATAFLINVPAILLYYLVPAPEIAMPASQFDSGWTVYPTGVTPTPSILTFKGLLRGVSDMISILVLSTVTASVWVELRQAHGIMGVKEIKEVFD